MTVSLLPPARRDLRASLLLLGLVVAFALAGLASDGNWPKLLRVSAAAAGYAGVLLRLARRSVPPLPWGPFAAAGAAAGLVSGVARPELAGPLVAAQVAGGLVLGSFHWLALRSWRGFLPPSRSR